MNSKKDTKVIIIGANENELARIKAIELAQSHVDIVDSISLGITANELFGKQSSFIEEVKPLRLEELVPKPLHKTVTNAQRKRCKKGLHSYLKIRVEETPGVVTAIHKCSCGKILEMK